MERSMSDTTLSFEEWLEYGVSNGYCSPQVCATHAGLPLADGELDEDDFCIHVVRLGTEEDWQEDIENYLSLTEGR